MGTKGYGDKGIWGGIGNRLMVHFLGALCPGSNVPISPCPYPPLPLPYQSQQRGGKAPDVFVDVNTELGRDVSQSLGDVDVVGRFEQRGPCDSQESRCRSSFSCPYAPMSLPTP